MGLTAPICLLILVSGSVHVRSQEYVRPLTPLGLDEYFYIPEDNPLTPQKCGKSPGLLLPCMMAV